MLRLGKEFWVGFFRGFAFLESWSASGTGSDKRNQQAPNQARPASRGNPHANYLRSMRPTNIRNSQETYRKLQPASPLPHSIRWGVKYCKTFKAPSPRIFNACVARVEAKRTCFARTDFWH